MLKVKKENLLIVAGIVWFLAGVNILRIGIMSIIALVKDNKTVALILAVAFALLILVGFLIMFYKVVNKHCRRILSYTEKKSIFLFFDLKGYLLMAFMMGLGITLRAIDLIPTAFFAAFYTGLGIALAWGGVRFILCRIKPFPLEEDVLPSKATEEKEDPTPLTDEGEEPTPEAPAQTVTED